MESSRPPFPLPSSVDIVRDHRRHTGKRVALGSRLSARFARFGFREPIPELRYDPVLPTVLPRIVVSGAEQLVAFIKHVFGATGEYSAARPAELRIGDSVILVSDAGVRETYTAFLYVYVADADATYRTAVDAGAITIEEPLDTPYGDRRAMVEDPWGNTWQIATPQRVADTIAHHRSVRRRLSAEDRALLDRLTAAVKKRLLARKPPTLIAAATRIVRRIIPALSQAESRTLAAYALDGLAADLQSLQLQSEVQNQSRSFTAVSNIMKTKHDTVKNSISNIR